MGVARESKREGLIEVCNNKFDEQHMRMEQWEKTTATDIALPELEQVVQALYGLDGTQPSAANSAPARGVGHRVGQKVGQAKRCGASAAPDDVEKPRLLN
jgi:hypothetical protein